MTSVAADEGNAYWFSDQRIVVKFPAADIGTSIGVTEITTPGGSGPPPHVHSREDELFYILEGVYDFLLGDQQFEVPASTWVFGPRGQDHGYVVRSGIGRHLSLTVPGGFEQFFQIAGRPALTRTLPDEP
jgi:mannose-6-phosphate isomerase-like protein (cupin superfamily)